MKPFLTATWALKEVQCQLDDGQEAQERSQNYAAVLRQEQTVALFREQAFKFRTQCGMILNTLKMQVRRRLSNLHL